MLLPSKPLLDGHKTRSDALSGARFAETTIHSVALHIIPPDVARTVQHVCKLPLFGL
jgi:hypothetical protein